MKLTLWTITLYVLLLLLHKQRLDAKRVVQIPVPSASHSKYHIKVAQALHNLGHQVWVALPTYLLERGVLDTSNITVIPYKLKLNCEELLMREIAERHLSGLPVDMWKTFSDAMDHIMDYPRPTLPNVKLIGGTVTEHAKPLPPELQPFMDSATHGAVIVTFGGSVLGVPKHISNKLFQVFHDLPFKVVFRSNLTSPDPAKVWTSKWLPQNDLLGHPNTKVFVSHCGKNGQYEALFHAVPLLCTPIFAEQSYNSERIRKKGFGEVVDLRSVIQEELLTRILAVAQDPGYKLAISKASTLFRQQYGSPMEEAAKWLDHVMEHGSEYMRYAGQKMPLYQFLGLDVFAFVFALGMMMCTLMYCCVKMLCRCCLKRKHKVD
ncbi:hypothetical protein ACOMHN_056361 [Nucella lapillus]